MYISHLIKKNCLDTNVMFKLETYVTKSMRITFVNF